MASAMEASVARLEERMQRIHEDNQDAKKSRKEMYGKLEEMNGRLHQVESALASAAPTIAEFVVIKHKISGAGMVGRWLWLAGGVLISSAAFIAGLPGVLRAWFAGN